MFKKISLLLVFGMSFLLLSGCELFGVTISTTTTTSTTASTQSTNIIPTSTTTVTIPTTTTTTATIPTTTTTANTVSNQEFQAIYGKNYYNLLSGGLYNEDMVNYYSNQDFMTYINDIMTSMTTGNPPAFLPTVTTINKTDFSNSDLSDITLNNLNSTFGVTGPLDIAYANLASAQLFLKYLEPLNAYISTYGSIAFNGTTITIPAGDIFGTVPDPLNPGKNLTLNDLTAKFVANGNTATEYISTEDNYSYTGTLPDNGPTGTFSGTAGVYFTVSVTVDNNGNYTVNAAFYIKLHLNASMVMGTTGTLNLDNTTPDTGSVDLTLGYSFTGIDNQSVVVNTSLSTSVKYTPNSVDSQIPPIDETATLMSSSAVKKTDTGTVADFKFTTDALQNAELSYQIVGDNTGAYAYFGGSITDQEFYGVNIPEEAFNGIFVYVGGQLIFVGGNADLNIPQYDAEGNYTGNLPENYYGYLWNLHDLTGWTEIRQSSTNIAQYVLYNGDNVILSGDDQVPTFDASNNLSSVQILYPIAVSVGGTEYDVAAYGYISQGDTPALSLPDGLTSPNFDYVNGLYSNFSQVKTGNIIDFSDSEYQVPALDTDLFS